MTVQWSVETGGRCNENLRLLYAFQKSDVNYCPLFIFYYILKLCNPSLISSYYRRRSWETNSRNMAHWLRILCVWAGKMTCNNMTTVIIDKLYSHFSTGKVVSKKTRCRKPTPFLFHRLRLRDSWLITEFPRIPHIFWFYFSLLI